MFDFDLTGVEAQQFGSFKVLPVGTYIVQIDDTIEKTSSTGNPMVELKLSVADGDHKGKKLKHYVVFSDKTKGMAKHFLKCIEEPCEGKIKPDPVQWIGKIFTAEVIVEPFTNKDGKTFDQNKIKAIYPEEIPF